MHDLESCAFYGFMGDCGTRSPDRSVESSALEAPPETASGPGWKQLPNFDGPPDAPDESSEEQLGHVMSMKMPSGTFQRSGQVRQFSAFQPMISPGRGHSGTWLLVPPGFSVSAVDPAHAQCIQCALCMERHHGIDNCQVTPRPPTAAPPPRPQGPNREWQAPHFTAED